MFIKIQCVALATEIREGKSAVSIARTFKGKQRNFTGEAFSYHP
jgi:hypothetical protein